MVGDEARSAESPVRAFLAPACGEPIAEPTVNVLHYQGTPMPSHDWDDEQRINLLGLLLENMGADQAVRMGDPAVWRDAIQRLK